jgi:hypothetical protein
MTRISQRMMAAARVPHGQLPTTAPRAQKTRQSSRAVLGGTPLPHTQHVLANCLSDALELLPTCVAFVGAGNQRHPPLSRLTTADVARLALLVSATTVPFWPRRTRLRRRDWSSSYRFCGQRDGSRPVRLAVCGSATATQEPQQRLTYRSLTLETSGTLSHGLLTRRSGSFSRCRSSVFRYPTGAVVLRQITKDAVFNNTLGVIALSCSRGFVLPPVRTKGCLSETLSQESSVYNHHLAGDEARGIGCEVDCGTHQLF